MVKTCLRHELAVTEKNPAAVAVTNLPLDKGGEFLVTVQFDMVRQQRVIVGGIGIQPCMDDERKDRNLPRTTTERESSSGIAYFEIHRLFVNSELQGQGIDTALVEAVQDFVARKTGDAVLRATTPQLLQSANQFTRQGPFHFTSKPRWAT